MARLGGPAKSTPTADAVSDGLPTACHLTELIHVSL